MKLNKHLLFIIIVILMALVVTIAIKYHVTFHNIWLWFIGFLGVIVTTFRKIGLKIGSFFASEPSVAGTSIATKTVVETPSKPIASLLPVSNGKTDTNTILVNVLRYTDDSETTLGLLYIDDKFYCYTLEDTYREVKVPGKTRIPAGSYKLDFIKQITPLTLTYRQTRDWFDYHLEIKNVPGFVGVYVHNGGTSADTEGCLLIADGITSNDSMKTLTNSRKTFEEFYKLIGGKLRNNYSVNINIYDENWIDHLKN